MISFLYVTWKSNRLIAQNAMSIRQEANADAKMVFHLVTLTSYIAQLQRAPYEIRWVKVNWENS
jgi:hypothetical protein